MHMCIVMIATGAKSIGMLLCNNHTLKVLDVGWNDIKDVGISEIVAGLQSNKTLSTLNVASCQISDIGDELVYTKHSCIVAYTYCIAVIRSW